MKYPVEISIKGKIRLICRPVKKSDFKLLRQFYKKIPKRDLEIFKDDIISENVPYNSFNDSNDKKITHLVTLQEKRIVADAVLCLEGIYWQNAGEIKIIVDPEHRKKGLGSQIFYLILLEGISNGIQKLIVRYTPDNLSIIKILGKYGFAPEIVLNYYVEDKKKKLHKDLVIASFNVEDWKRKFEFYSF